MDYIFNRELTDNERMAEVNANLNQRNHQSTTSWIADLIEKVKSDVIKGYALPVCKSIVKLIKNVMVQPVGLAAQFTLIASELRVLKDRLTHDLSWATIFPEALVNKRCDMDSYPEMVHGHCMKRIIHYVVALRLKYPDEIILISNYNMSDAYCWMVHSSSAAAQTILVLDDRAYIMLRLLFGGSPNPAC